MTTRRYPLLNGHIYHIFTRSIAGFKIFKSNSDYERIKNLLLLGLTFSKSYQRLKDYVWNKYHTSTSGVAGGNKTNLMIQNKIPPPKEICIILTYRCNAKCNMCDVWHYPTKSSDEITLKDIEKLPSGLRFMNVTGGEPFIRKDINEIIDVIRPKTNRIVISTNGFFTEKIIKLFEKYPDLGIRISIEGLQKSNDTIRGIRNGFDRGLRTLLTLRKMGIKDIGFGMTVQDVNCRDLLPLYELSEALGYEFATATLHNSHYFHKLDNRIEKTDMVCNEFSRLITELLKSKSPKKWFRAYFNYGLMNYIHGGKRFLKCEMGTESCFIDPSGDVLPCNGMNNKMPMGNIREQTFDDIWNSSQADDVRKAVDACNKECWMVGSAAPVMKKHKRVPVKWVLKNKLRVMMGKEPDLCFHK